MWTIPQCSVSHPTPFISFLSGPAFRPPPTLACPTHSGLPAFSRDFTSKGKGWFVTEEKVKPFLKEGSIWEGKISPGQTCSTFPVSVLVLWVGLLLLLFIQHRGSALNRCLGWHGSLCSVNRAITKQWSYYIRSKELAGANQSCPLGLQSYNYPKF